MLRLGYGAFGLAFAALGASFFAGAALPLALVLGFLGGVLLAFSDDDLPKWAGLALVLYFLLSLAAFAAATPVTVRLEAWDGFVNSAPSPLAEAVFEYLVLAMPLMLGATAIVAAWEREWPPRVLLVAAVAGFVLVALLTILLVPRGTDSAAIAAATTQGRLLEGLFAVSAAAGAVGALWAAARPEEVA